MPASATNLVQGPATLWTGDVGETEPLDTAVASDPGAGWTDRGGTDDGVTLTVSQEWVKLRMDQTIDAPGRRRTERDITIATNLAEVTVENFALAVAQAETTIETGGTGPTAWKAMDFEGDDAGEEPPYVACILRGRAPNGKKRNVIIRKALSVEEMETSYKKADQTLYPVTLAAHWVSTTVRPTRVVDTTAV